MSQIRESLPHALPFVSVVVPVRNAPGRVKTCIEALLAQTYPQDRYEIIVVDNDSTDQTRQVIQSYPVTLLIETSMASPYPARNRGIRHARGEIIALTDANVIPLPHWLEQGVQALEHEQADLAGGHITFTFSPEKTIGEIVDSLIYINIKGNVPKGMTVCTNLFARKAVFDAIGLFAHHIRSGGDTLWTWQATQAGFKLIYATQAEGLYPARKLFPLLKKSYRTSKGTMYVHMKRGINTSVWQILYKLVYTVIIPRHTRATVYKIRERGTPDMLQHFLAIWFVIWLRNFVVMLGMIDGRLHLQRQIEAEKQYVPEAGAPKCP